MSEEGMEALYGNCIIGDCVESVKQLPDECIDMVFTVPPQGDSWSYQGFEVKPLPNEKTYPWFFPDLAAHLFRVLKPGGVLCWNVGDMWEIGQPFEINACFRQFMGFKSLFNCHATLILDTQNNLRREVYSSAFEFIFCMSKGVPKTFNRQHDSKVWRGASRIEEDYNYARKIGSNVINTPHNAPTRIWLTRDLILTYTQEGDVILDPFSGSGTTLQVGKKLNRRVIGIEPNEEYAGLFNVEIDV
jgi:DNA modification methylase